MKHVKCSLAELTKLIEKGAQEIHKNVGAVLEVVAKKAVPVVQNNVPVAFGELRDSAHAVPGDEPKTVLDAPHAAAVEIGSPPHKPNFERLLAWVKLRGFQGLQGKRAIRKMDGATTAKQATSIANEFRRFERRGNRRRTILKNGRVNPLKQGRHSPIDAAEQVARAISIKIEKEGTKPHWYARNSLPEIEKILHRQMKRNLKK